MDTFISFNIYFNIVETIQIIIVFRKENVGEYVLEG